MPQDSVPFREAFAAWAKIGLLSFGGPAGQIAVMHSILVEEKRWLSESRFLHALNYCMLLPGPEAMQLATYSGWLLHGTRGGLVAGTLFVLPGVVAILLLSILYVSYRELGVVEGLFFGLKAAVLAIVVEAVVRIGRRALRGRPQFAIAALAFVGIFLFDLPFPLIVASAAVGGYLVGRLGGGPAAVAADEALVAAGEPGGGLRRALRVTLTWLALWFAPIALLLATLGRDHVLTQEALFFSKAALVTFGGAYAVLAYIAQQAVDVYQWLLPGEMLDGLGMAETTPGPLIMVTQFVGFMGAFRFPEPFSPLGAAVLGSLITTWVTFVPCFLWIFLGAPYVERVQRVPAVAAALSGITAAVVGVILNLAVWFALHTLFADIDERRVSGLRLLAPDWATLDALALLLTAGAFVALFVLRLGVAATLAGAALAGIAMRTFW